MTFLYKHRILFIFNAVWIGVFFYYFNQLQQPISAKILFSTPDSNDYLKTAYEFFDWSQTGFSKTRPFLFPLIVRFFYGIFGAYGLWTFHFLSWLISVNLIFRSVQKMSKNVLFSGIISLIFCCNVTLIVMTLHGLTEVTSILLISLLCYWIILKTDRIWSFKTQLIILLLLVLLAVTKPLFYPIVLMFLAVVLIVQFKAFLKQPKKLLLFTAVLLPLFLQLGVMKVKYNTFTVSTISDLTWRRYITTQVLNNLYHFSPSDYATSEALALEMSKEELNTHFKSHFWLYYYHWKENMNFNLKHESNLLMYPVGYHHEKLYQFMQNTNNNYHTAHQYFLFLMPLAGLLIARRKAWNSLVVFIAIWGLCYYIFGTSGISFAQGDRLVLSSLPLFLLAYSLATVVLVNEGRKGLAYLAWKRSQRKEKTNGQ